MQEIPRVHPSLEWTSLTPEALQGASVVRGAGAGAYGAGALTGVVALDEKSAVSGAKRAAATKAAAAKATEAKALAEKPAAKKPAAKKAPAKKSD